jgi:hypothetical protein
VGDDGLALLLQQFDQPLLLGHQRVDLGGLAVEEGGDMGLFLQRNKWQIDLDEMRIPEFLPIPD